MKKVKSNFVLTKHNVGEFIKRFNKILNQTGMIVESGEYTSFVPKHLSRPLDLNAIRYTQNSYYDRDRIEFDTYPSLLSYTDDQCTGLIIRPNKDSCVVIDYGTAMHITTNSITYKSHNPYSKRFLINKMVVCSDIKKGKQENDFQDAVADMYYEDMENAMSYDREGL